MISDFIVLKDGLPILTVPIDQSKGISKNAEQFTLVSGFFQAITSFADTMDNLGEVDEVEMTDRIFSFQKHKMDQTEILFILSSNHKLEKSTRKIILKELTATFLHMYAQPLEQPWNGDIMVFDPFKSVVVEIVDKILKTKSEEEIDPLSDKTLKIPMPSYIPSVSNIGSVNFVPVEPNSINIPSYRVNSYSSIGSSTPTPSTTQSTPINLGIPNSISPNANLDLNQSLNSKKPAPMPIPNNLDNQINQNNQKNLSVQKLVAEPITDESEKYVSTRFQRYQTLREFRKRFGENLDEQTNVKSKLANKSTKAKIPWESSKKSKLQTKELHPPQVLSSTLYDVLGQSLIRARNEIYMEVDPEADYFAPPVPKRQFNRNLSSSFYDQLSAEEFTKPNKKSYERMEENQERLHNSVFDMIPSRFHLTAGLFQSLPANSWEKKLVFSIDGTKTIQELASFVDKEPMEILSACKELAEQKIIQLV
ncbi:MAG: hypothetical protein ACTSVU_08300 [Promethearchaeota archaeon]